MDIVKVEITGLAITARYGSLAPGDILRTDAEYARHLVEDCGAAKYCVAPSADTPEPQVTPRRPAKKMASPVDPTA